MVYGVSHKDHWDWGDCERYNHTLHELLQTLPTEKRLPAHLKELCYA